MCMCSLVLLLLPDDLKHLNDKLVEVSTSKLALQVKLDELEAVQVNVKVSNISVNCFYNKVVYIQSDLLLKVTCC